MKRHEICICAASIPGKGKGFQALLLLCEFEKFVNDALEQIQRKPLGKQEKHPTTGSFEDAGGGT